MIRCCDGTDPSLQRLNPATDQYETCGCGQVFDDVDQHVIWPHTPVGGDWAALVEAAAPRPAPDGPDRWEPLCDSMFMLPGGEPGTWEPGLHIRVTASRPFTVPAGLAWDLRDVVRRHVTGGDAWPTPPARTSP